MVPAVILAAGRSLRMGRPKALLQCPGTSHTFVRQLAGALFDGGVTDVLVVGRPEDDELRAEVDALSVPARFVTNPDADLGQLSSLLAGLRAADRPGVRGLLVAPVDVPLVCASTVTTLLTRFQSASAPIARAVHRGVHGHPVIFGRVVFAELGRADPEVGAKAVVRAHEASILNVEVDDPGVVRDVDTPQDYRRLMGGGGPLDPPLST